MREQELKELTGKVIEIEQYFVGKGVFEFSGDDLYVERGSFSNAREYILHDSANPQIVGKAPRGEGVIAQDEYIVTHWISKAKESLLARGSDM